MSVVGTSPAYQRASSVVMAWVRIYSRGLPNDIADSRRDELLADLHDQAAWADQTSKAARRAASEALVRAIKGAPSDLSWRSQQLDRNPVADRLLNSSMFGVVAVGSVLMLAFAIVTFVRGLHDFQQGWINAPGVLPVGVAGLTTICGLLLLRKSKTRSLAAIWLLGASQVIIWQGIDVFARTTTMLAWAEQAIRLWPACVAALAVGAALFYLAAALWWRPSDGSDQ